MSALHALNIDVKIWKMPVEIPNPIAFNQDTIHAAYDKEYARRFWRTLVSIDGCSRFSFAMSANAAGTFFLGQL